MRLRTPAALALVTALLAAPVAALACGFECGPAPSRAEAVKPVEAPPEGSCHRQLEEPADGGFTLSATPHDCLTHAPLVPRLTNPGAAASLAKSTAVNLFSPAHRLVIRTLIHKVSPWHTHDVAPPGRTPDLIAPLRI